MEEWIGIDIGGTKIAVVRGTSDGRILDKKRMDTGSFADWKEAVRVIGETAEFMKTEQCTAAGISCGGPLDCGEGMILSPPNLPGWDRVPVVKLLSEKLSLPVYLRNDADACALAEWKYGAGKGCHNLVFCTFGTGMGTGLILNNQLYIGRNGCAGEIGHMRVSDFGPSGYGKMGSFEGFCSGGGMAQLGQAMAAAAIQRGEAPFYCREKKELPFVTAKKIAEAAGQGDMTALQVFRQTGEMLGRGLAVLMDILNPDCVILGSIYARCEELLKPSMEKIIKEEVLAANQCPVLPAALGETIGDMAAICVAMEGKGYR